MKTKVLTAILVSLLLIPVVSSSKLIAAKPDSPEKGKKPDKRKPVPAADVELVKKITLKGRPPWAGGGKPKKKKEAATGVLGELVSGDKYAVVVGISDYPGSENDLNYCDDDALEMKTALTDVYGFTNVNLLTDEGATRYAILTAIDNIPAGADEVVFFFSGHGMKGIADDGDKEKMDEAIVTHDSTQLVPIWDGELKDAFAGFATSRIILIFDTCLAGGMKKDLEASGRVRHGKHPERGLAYESSEWQNGEFSYYFIDEGMLGGKANIHDYDGDDELAEPQQVTVEEAFDYAKANCDSDRPTVGDSFEDDLLL